MIMTSRYYLASLYNTRTKPKAHLTATRSVDSSREVDLCRNYIIPKWNASGESVMSLNDDTAGADSHDPYLRLVIHIGGAI